MSEVSVRRFAAIGGLGLAAAFAAWWLGSARLATDHGADAARSSAEALHIAWLVRALVVPVLGVRIGALRGWRAGAASSLAVVAPSWPVVAMAWSASTASLAQSLLAEGFLLAEAIVVPLIGQGLRRVVTRADLVESIASAAGVVLAAALWLGHDRWSFPSGL
ncbi:MAG: hypothetical protein ABI520_01590 [Caldimonas sp.]